MFHQLASGRRPVVRTSQSPGGWAESQCPLPEEVNSLPYQCLFFPDSYYPGTLGASQETSQHSRRT